MQGAINNLTSITNTIVGFANSILIANQGLFSTYTIATNVVTFILQFIPSPIMRLFIIEIIWGVGFFLLKVVHHIKVVLDWW